jgi:hypothetical protein
LDLTCNKSRKNSPTGYEKRPELKTQGAFILG